MSEEIFLKLEGIKKSFGGVHALKGVDLEIRKGEIHCLAGENGCGKSTLIKAISSGRRLHLDRWGKSREYEAYGRN